MALTEKELLEYKSNIEDSKTRIANLKGQQKMILKQLKENFDCTSIEEAEQKIKEFEKAISILEKKIVKQTSELETKLPVSEE